MGRFVSAERTDIHDQAWSPRVQAIKSNARSPEKAPVAAPKNRPTRYCNLWRGYHNDKLHRIPYSALVALREKIVTINLLEHNTRGKTSFCNTEADKDADKL